MITASDSISLYSREEICKSIRRTLMGGLSKVDEFRTFISLTYLISDSSTYFIGEPLKFSPKLPRFFSDKYNFQLYVGLSVVYLSGRRSSSVQQFGTYSQYDVDALRPIAEEPKIVDLRQLFNYVEVGTRDQASDIVTESDQFSCCMGGFRIKALD
ncbi:hypothetical protein RJT34_02724 [Clitoria ternatea]|uniref:Uncharacterized protein n=1 Tax=Clitoria ternatea TaxID=43366 RepID=A0AAN9KIF6_CLITE